MAACVSPAVAARWGFREPNAYRVHPYAIGIFSSTSGFQSNIILLYYIILRVVGTKFYFTGSASQARATIMSIQTSNAADWAGADRAARSDTAPRLSEDWLSVIIGLLIFVLALAVLANVDLIGCVGTNAAWRNRSVAL